MARKKHEWLRRYLPADIIALGTLFVGGAAAHYFFQNAIVTAFGATCGENVGYYGTILYADLRARKKRDKKLRFVGVCKVLRNMVIEFGPAEYLDSFFIRPAVIYLFMWFTGSVPIGLFLGKIVADVSFYIPTITAYELRKKYLRD